MQIIKITKIAQTCVVEHSILLKCSYTPTTTILCHPIPSRLSPLVTKFLICGWFCFVMQQISTVDYGEQTIGKELLPQLPWRLVFKVLLFLGHNQDLNIGSRVMITSVSDE